MKLKRRNRRRREKVFNEIMKLKLI